MEADFDGWKLGDDGGAQGLVVRALGVLERDEVQAGSRQLVQNCLPVRRCTPRTEREVEHDIPRGVAADRATELRPLGHSVLLELEPGYLCVGERAFGSGDVELGDRAGSAGPAQRIESLTPSAFEL